MRISSAIITRTAILTEIDIVALHRAYSLLNATAVKKPPLANVLDYTMPNIYTVQTFRPSHVRPEVNATNAKTLTRKVHCNNTILISPRATPHRPFSLHIMYTTNDITYTYGNHRKAGPAFSLIEFTKSNNHRRHNTPSYIAITNV